MTIRYSKDPTTLQHPASLLKMMTALVARDWVNNAAMDDIVTVDISDMHLPTTAQLQVGDLISLRDLFYGMLVPSGNDAALTMSRVVGTQILQAEGVQGDPRTRFLQAMADKAVELDLQGAVFETPHGGGADRQSRLSAEHSIKLLTECYNDPTLREIMSAQSREITVTGVNARTYTVHHTLDIDGPVLLPEFIMGKTGSHVAAGAGYCVAIIWANPTGGLRATVVMNATTVEDRVLDLRKLMDFDIAKPLTPI